MARFLRSASMHIKWKILLMAFGLIGFFITSLVFAQRRKAQRSLVTEPAHHLNAVRVTNDAASPADVQENAKDGLKYVRIPAGTLMMGCSPGDRECQPDEKPSHEVTITKDFWIGQTEVTVGAYKRFIAATGREIHAAPSFNQDWANENLPIVSVTWDESRDYCVWAGGRLPTEAEWEYAARGGSKQARYGSLAEIASSSPYGSLPRGVGQKRANDFGLFDVMGNASEWVNDWYDEKYYQH